MILVFTNYFYTVYFVEVFKCHLIIVDASTFFILFSVKGRNYIFVELKLSWSVSTSSNFSWPIFSMLSTFCYIFFISISNTIHTDDTFVITIAYNPQRFFSCSLDIVCIIFWLRRYFPLYFIIAWSNYY